MPGEPVEPPTSPEDPMVVLLQRQMVRLKRWFQWERWLLEPRSFAPPDDDLTDEDPLDDADDPPSRN